jgi:hypothetical protein
MLLFTAGQSGDTVTHLSYGKGKGKSKVHPVTGHEGPEGEQMYSFTLPSTSAPDVVGAQHHAPAALPPGKDQIPIS